MKLRGRLVCWGLLAAAAAVVPPVGAQEFGVYLTCKGKVVSGGKSLFSHVDLALRRNSELAVIQSSDIMPAGEKMRLAITPQFYTMVFKAPLRGSAVFYDWLRGALMVWEPNLEKLHTIRISVNRQSAALEGDMRDQAEKSIGRLDMQCVPKDNDSVEEPKF